jgi:hypothetical protein
MFSNTYGVLEMILKHACYEERNNHVEQGLEGSP